MARAVGRVNRVNQRLRLARVQVLRGAVGDAVAPVARRIDAQTAQGHRRLHRRTRHRRALQHDVRWIERSRVAGVRVRHRQVTADRQRTRAHAQVFRHRTRVAVRPDQRDPRRIFRTVDRDRDRAFGPIEGRNGYCLRASLPGIQSLNRRVAVAEIEHPISLRIDRERSVGRGHVLLPHESRFSRIGIGDLDGSTR